MNKKNWTLLAVILCCLLISVSVLAKKRPGIHPLLSHDISIGLGWFHPNTNSSVLFNGSITEPNNDEIDLEDEFHFSQQDNVFLGSINWRFSTSFVLSYEYLALNRESTAVLGRDIHWNEYVFGAGSTASARFDVSIHRLFLGYSFIQQRHYELGAGLGMHLLDLDASISGTAQINDDTFSDTVSSNDLLAPLPNIGVYAAYAFNRHWLVSGRYDWFSINTGEYDGSLHSSALNLHYQALKNIGIGIGYQYFNIDITADKPDWNGSARFSYTGPKLFLTASF